LGHPLIVSYYTPNTPYEGHARELAASARRLGLDARIESRPAKASWVENCAQKSLFIQEMRRATDRSILWVDADAVIRRPLTELVNCHADMAAVKRQGWDFSGGQIYFGTGPGAEALIDLWCRYCRDFPHVWDQVSLGYAWWDMALENRISVEWLPETILAKVKQRPISARMQMAFSRAAILHKQESRSSKKVRHRRDEEFPGDLLPEWWRAAAIKNLPFAIGPELLPDLGLRQADISSA
jgi:hypothetical protein